MKSEKRINDIKVVVFDADDTLWDCQSHFDRMDDRMAEMLEPWCPHEIAHTELLKTERDNLSLSGYGSKAFTLSVLETAIRVSHGAISSDNLATLIEMGKGLMRMPVEPLPEVTETLERMSRYYKVVFTKGDLLDQEQKLHRSGLDTFFQHTEITSNKSEREFLRLCDKLSVKPHEMVMVGNSFKSDIAPALAIGAWGIYIPYDVVWEIELADEFEHDHCFKINHFSEILKIIA